jgi:hypothetical protein
MNKFKVGDRVKYISTGEIGTIKIISAYNQIKFDIFKSGGGGLYDEIYGGCYYNANDFEIELVSNIDNMNIIEKFTLNLKSEPEKSFRKAGIINGDDLLTDDGQKIFLTWLLSKNKAEFKTEVVDGILEEMKDEK